MEDYPNSNDFDPTKEPFWTLPLALTWIIYHDLNRISDLMKHGKEKKTIFDIVNDAVRNESDQAILVKGTIAKDDFWEKLKNEKLIAEGIANGEQVHRTIKGSEWKVLYFWPKANIPFDAVAGETDTHPRYHDVFVRQKDVVSIWPITKPEDRGSKVGPEIIAPEKSVQARNNRPPISKSDQQRLPDFIKDYYEANPRASRDQAWQGIENDRNVLIPRSVFRKAAKHVPAQGVPGRPKKLKCENENIGRRVYWRAMAHIVGGNSGVIPFQHRSSIIGTVGKRRVHHVS